MNSCVQSWPWAPSATSICNWVAAEAGDSDAVAFVRAASSAASSLGSSAAVFPPPAVAAAAGIAAGGASGGAQRSASDVFAPRSAAAGTSGEAGGCGGGFVDGRASGGAQRSASASELRGTNGASAAGGGCGVPVASAAAGLVKRSRSLAGNSVSGRLWGSAELSDIPPAAQSLPPPASSQPFSFMQQMGEARELPDLGPADEVSVDLRIHGF